MNPIESNDALNVNATREPWETPTIVSCAFKDTNKTFSDFIEDPLQGPGGS